MIINERKTNFRKQRVFIVIAFVFLVLLFCNKAFAGSGQCGENVYWSTDSKGELKIYGSGPMYDYLGSNSPGWGSNIITLRIQEGVTSIGAGAFKGAVIRDIYLPESLRSIGEKAFYDVQVRDNTISYGSNRSIPLPSGITFIGEDAFLWCNARRKATIGSETAKTLGAMDLLFYPSDYFDDYIQLQYYQINGKWELALVCVLNNNDKLLPSSNFVVPDGVNIIKDYAFVPKDLPYTSRPQYKQCLEVSSVTLPDTIHEIEPNAFTGIKKRTLYANSNSSAAVAVSRNRWVFIDPHTSYILTWVFDNDEPIGLELYGVSVAETAEVVLDIPEYVISIGQIHSGASNIQKIIIPSSVGKIKSNAFMDCDHLTEGIEIKDCGSFAYGWCRDNEVVCTVIHTGDVEEDEQIEPTCITSGISSGTHCSRCGETLSGRSIIDPIGHNKIIDSEAVAPTCVEDGLTEQSHCSICNEILSVQSVVPALGHTIVIDPYEPPKTYCTGLTEGSHCSVCHTVIKRQEIIDKIYAPSFAVQLNGCIGINIPETYKTCSYVWNDYMLHPSSILSSHGFYCVDMDDWSISIFEYNKDNSATSLSDLFITAGYSITPESQPLNNPAFTECVYASKYIDDYYVTVFGFSTDSYQYIVISRSSTSSASFRNLFFMAGTLRISHSLHTTASCQQATEIANGHIDNVICSACGEVLEAERTVLPNEVLWLPNSLTEIEDEAFRNVKAKQVVIPSGCTTIGSMAFWDSEIIIYVIPSSVSYIDDNAFDNFGEPVIVTDKATSYAAVWGRKHNIAVYIVP